MSDELKRAQGAALGYLMGDCIGMPTEWLTAKEAKEAYGMIGGVGAASETHPFWPGRETGLPTNVTDDFLSLSTQLAVAGDGFEESLSRLLTDDSESEFDSDSEMESKPAAPSDADVDAEPSARAKRGTRVVEGAESVAGRDLKNIPMRSQGVHRGYAGDALPEALLIGMTRSSKRDDTLLLTEVAAFISSVDGTTSQWEGSALLALTVSSIIDGASIWDAVDSSLASVAQTRAIGARTPASSVIARVLEGRDKTKKMDEKALTPYLKHSIGLSTSVHEALPAAILVALLYRDNPFVGLCNVAQTGGASSYVGAMAGALLGASLPDRTVPYRQLDQINADYRERVLAAVNQFEDRHGPARILGS